MNFALAAQALGAWGRRIASLEELAGALRVGMELDRPVVIDVPIDPTELPCAQRGLARQVDGWYSLKTYLIPNRRRRSCFG